MGTIAERLQRCGIAAHEAEQIIRSFQKNLSYGDLLEYVKAIEVDAYVDRLQSKPYRKKG